MAAIDNDDFIPEQTEARIQGEAFQWFHNSYPALRGLLYHVPNGGVRDRLTANTLKATGVVAGVPDLEFHFWKRTFFFEFKTPTGKVTPVQAAIHSKLKEHGFLVFVVRSVDEFKTFIHAILEDRSPNFSLGMTRENFDYRNKVFSFLYEMEIGTVQLLENLVSDQYADKFKNYIFEFMTDGFDKIAGFEILFTSDYKGFYKKENADTIVLYQGYSTENIPNG